MPKSGGSGEQYWRGKLDSKWRGCGIFFCREVNGAVEICAVYEEHVPAAIRDELLTRFGIAAREWKVLMKEEK